MDRLPATFSNLHASVAEGLGHFVHYEAPQRAAHEIAAFFEACSYPSLGHDQNLSTLRRSPPSALAPVSETVQPLGHCLGESSGELR